MRHGRPRVVVTGIGAVSPSGVGREAFGRACGEGRSGVSGLRIDTTGLKSTVAAAVHAFDPTGVMEGAELRRVPRMIPMALFASREAMVQSGLLSEGSDGSGALGAKVDSSVARSIGVSLGTGGGGLAFVEEQYRTFFTQ